MIDNGKKDIISAGQKSALPTLSAGEPAFALDTKELYIGTGDGTASVVGKGDMLKSVYDTNNNGKVDDSDKLGGQPPEYYAAEYPVYTAWVERWQSNNKYYLNLPNAPNIAQSGMKKFAIDVVKNYGIENDNYIDVVYLYFGDDVSQEPTDTTSLYVHNESSGALLRVEDIKKEGYDGSELYHTWHGFLGLREDKIVYAAAKCGYEQMHWIMAALGMRDAIKLDGGGSFILQNGAESVSTDENRRINNIGMWH